MPAHVFHVGYPKAASTYLQRWFEAHPAVRYRPFGIAGHHGTWGFLADVPLQAEPPPCAVTSDERFVFPVTHDAIGLNADGRVWASGAWVAEQQARVCAGLHALRPESRVLIVTRGFAGIIRSTYTQYLRLGGRERFGDFLALTEPFWPHYLDYSRVVGLYEAAFGRENVTALPYELLEDDAPAFRTAVAEVLGVEAGAYDPGRPNASFDARRAEGVRRTSVAVAAVAGLLPSRARRRAFGAYQLGWAYRERGVALARLVGRRGAEDGAEAQLTQQAEALSGCAAGLEHRPFYPAYWAAYAPARG